MRTWASSSLGLAGLLALAAWAPRPAGASVARSAGTGPRGLPSQAQAPVLEARLRVFRPLCARPDEEALRRAVQQASSLLEARCAVRLRLAAWKELPLASRWCSLPLEPGARRKAVASLAAKGKAGAAGDLAFWLLPTASDERFSYSLVDASRAADCDSPQEARYLDRFGHCVFTDLAWTASAGPKAASPSAAALLVAHEALHALTQRGHPTHEPRGEVMADHWADQGPGIGEDWCACARRSPYLKPAKAGKGKP